MTRMREALPSTPEEKKKILERGPVMPDLSSMYGTGLLEGYNINPDDVVAAPSFKSSLHSTTNLSNIPDANETPLESGWVRQKMPSLGIPYGISEFLVRAFDIATLSRVHAAQQTGINNSNHKKALSLLLDAIAPTIKDFDIRDLTVPDFYSHMYWLRLNSYTRAPMMVPWTSRYGNENVTRITKSSFEFQELSMTRETYLQWRAKGITYPTVRDMEVLADNTLDEDQRWLITYAQYVLIEGKITPDIMQKKIQKLNDMGPDAIPMINEFASLTEHGVIEQVKVRDTKFNLDEAIEYIEDEIQQLTKLLDSMAEENDTETTRMGQLMSLGNHIDGRVKELKMLREVKANDGLTAEGKIFQPEEEVVALATANAAILFP